MPHENETKEIFSKIFHIFYKILAKKSKRNLTSALPMKAGKQCRKVKTNFKKEINISLVITLFIGEGAL